MQARRALRILDEHAFHCDHHGPSAQVVYIGHEICRAHRVLCCVGHSRCPDACL